MTTPTRRRNPPENHGHVRYAAALLLCACLAGCAGMQHREPLSLEQVIQMSKAQTPPADIIAQLTQTRTVLQISGSQFARLREQGVDDAVLDHLQKSFVDSVEMEARLRTQSMYWGYGGGWGGHYRPFYGPWPYGYRW